MTQSLLWVDADTEFTIIGQRYLAAKGFQVTTTDDAIVCLNRLRRTMPDVLLLDEELSTAGPERILDWLREQVPQKELPVVLVSGDDPPETMSGRTGVAAACCLQKPYRLPSILEAVAAGSVGTIEPDVPFQGEMCQ